MMSADELESGNTGEPAKLIRQRYREAADIIKKGKMSCFFINDLDARAGRLGGITQYIVNNQMVNATFMNIADNPTNVQLPGMYNKDENPCVPVIVTDKIGVCHGIFRTDNVPKEDIVKLVDTFPRQSIDFFGAIRARLYDDEVKKWISEIGVESIGKRLVNSKEAHPTFEQPKMTLEKLLEYGSLLVQEQDNVKRVQLVDMYLNEAALGKAAQQVKVPVPEGCTNQSLANFDPTARVMMVAASINFRAIQKKCVEATRRSISSDLEGDTEEQIVGFRGDAEEKIVRF
ncbi:hypothetical protein EZV62_015587 [Acer yangbiense]|uniref:Ribulose bisphosphate carboxylase/oxygenase activase AAA helical domain-containing protein n=1 Tax=Acer yangbiense TaxID=1000413 RepID=A0A5C7HLL0_9ROSI|nr:hypothetical protein EZV62_015587 [Acer yangbiense]